MNGNLPIDPAVRARCRYQCCQWRFLKMSKQHTKKPRFCRKIPRCTKTCILH